MGDLPVPNAPNFLIQFELVSWDEIIIKSYGI